MDGIELSPSMVAQLRRREGIATIDVTIVDSRVLDLPIHGGDLHIVGVRATSDQDQQAPIPVDATETWLPEPRALNTLRGCPPIPVRLLSG